MAADDPYIRTKKVLFTPGEKRAAGAEYLEQYKLYLEMLDRISERRQTANSYFLTINTGLCGLVGYLFSRDAAPELHNLFWLIPIAGILLSYFWYRLVRSYRDLNSAKFTVVHLIEEHLPLAPYKAEWIELGEGKDSKRYTPFTHLEIWVPRSFMIMYFVLLIYLAPWGAFFGLIGKFAEFIC
jgi:hypothetical protein